MESNGNFDVQQVTLFLFFLQGSFFRYNRGILILSKGELALPGMGVHNKR